MAVRHWRGAAGDRRRLRWNRRRVPPRVLHTHFGHRDARPTAAVDRPCMHLLFPQRQPVRPFCRHSSRAAPSPHNPIAARRTSQLFKVGAGHEQRQDHHSAGHCGQRGRRSSSGCGSRGRDAVAPAPVAGAEPPSRRGRGRRSRGLSPAPTAAAAAPTTLAAAPAAPSSTRTTNAPTSTTAATATATAAAPATARRYGHNCGGGRPGSRSGCPTAAHQAAHERVHGVVKGTAAQDGSGKPEDAQLRDQQAAGSGVEAPYRTPETAVHRRSQTVEVTFIFLLYVVLGLIALSSS